MSLFILNSNTTLVKVKSLSVSRMIFVTIFIQIQHLLKLNYKFEQSKTYSTKFKYNTC